MPIRWRCRELGWHKERLHEDDWAYIDEWIGPVRVREPLETRDERRALAIYRDKLKEYTASAPDPNREGRLWRRFTFAQATEKFCAEKGNDVSHGQLKSWKASGNALTSVFGEKHTLGRLTPDDIVTYKNKRIGAIKQRAEGTVKPKTVANELAFLRLLLKRCGLWPQFRERFTMPKVTNQRQGRALRDEEQIRLFQVAQSKPKYRWVYVMLVLGYYCGMRPCECFGLHWLDLHLDEAEPTLDITRSKTPAGWRYPSLNRVCVEALRMLREQAIALGIFKPDYFAFPYHLPGSTKGHGRRLDPTRPMTKYTRQWNEIKKLAGLDGFWFYDGRHTARTKMAEEGLSDEVMDAQMGHVSKLVGKRYSHIRRQALNKAAAALEPSKAVERIMLIVPEVDENATVQ